jgi:fermentation-respiration switch protein FrsA (DUF1100 family)
MRRAALWIGCLSFLCLSACTRLFFQPSRVLIQNPQQMGLSYQDVSFNSADGTKLHGWFFPAQTMNVKGTFVQVHGNAENISTHFASLVWVTKHGYNLLTFDYRGYGQSAGQVSMEGAHKDVRAAIDEARALSNCHGGGPLIVYGQSLGGALLLYTVGTLADRRAISLVIVDSAFNSYQALAREKLAGSWVTFLLQPLAYILISDRYAPKRVVADISPLPLLVIHGERDGIVPWHHGRAIYEQAKAPKWFWKLPGIGHIQAMSAHSREYRQALLDFLDHLDQASE